MSKLKVAVLFGGVSTEHDVSLVSATYILKNLSTSLFEVFPVGISKSGQWFLYSGLIDNIANGNWINDKNNCQPTVFSSDLERKGFLLIKPDSSFSLIKIDCIFLVLHGRNGEDGRLQGYFDAADVPYVGCDLISSANCMDKELTHIVLNHSKIRTTLFKTILKRDVNELQSFCCEIKNSFSFPVFVKPANSGSSIGITKCNQANELADAVLHAFKFDSKVLCEQAVVDCKEVECAVLGNEEPQAANCLGEIKSTDDFYDYESKYNDKSELIVPARLSKSLENQVKDIAVKAFKAMGCSGLARVDFLISKTEEIYVNEINTMPGFTQISMFPRLWRESGLDGPALVSKLIELAIQRFNKNRLK